MDLSAVYNWAIQLAEAHWRDILPVAVGTLGGMSLTAGVEYFVPTTLPTNTQKGITWLANVLLSWLLSTLLWGFIDGTDSMGLRATMSLACSAISVWLYPGLGRWATKKWPAIASIYASA